MSHTLRIKSFAASVGVASLFASGVALAAEPTTSTAADAGAASNDDQPVAVAVVDTPVAHRDVLVEWNPLSLVIVGRISANVVITPKEHHALTITPYYGWANTGGIDVPVSSSDPNSTLMQLPKQHFDAFGGEIGYRYYFGSGGPRGIFLGPSLLIADVNAKAQDGATTNFLNFGLAADIGYQAIVAERLSLSLGAGVQYTATSKSIPDQQFPAEVSANAGIRPRVLASIGWAF